MPRKPRTRKRSRYDARAPGVRLALRSVRAWEAYWGGEAEGRAAWEALRGELQTNPGTRPAPFWAYEPGVPEELRSDVPAPDPRPVLSGGPVEGGAAHRSHARARLEWLLQDGRGYLRPGEPAAIERRLSNLEDPSNAA